MERWRRGFTKSDTDFKELFGVKKEVFHEKLAVVTVVREERLRKGGRKPKLSAGDPLFLALQSWRESRTMAHLAFDFGMAQSTVSDTIVMVENVLIQDQSFHLPGKKALFSKENAGRTLAVDVTESPIERPQKNKNVGIPARKSDIRSRCKPLPTLTLRKFSALPKRKVPFTISSFSRRRSRR